MITVDSLCFETNSEYARPNIHKFDEITKQNKELGIQQTYFESKNIASGISKITYLPETGSVTFNISGKVLSDEHKQLISQSNIEDVFKVINSTGMVNADCLSVLENSTVRKVDFTENIHVPNVSEYLNAVSVISNLKYNKDNYVGRGEDVGKTGVVFRGTFKTFREYLLFYDKRVETKKDAYNGILRIESKRANFAAIRKDVAAENNLFDIFTSCEKPVLKVYSRIAKMNITNFKLYDMAHQVSDIKQLLYESLLQQSGNDMQTVKEMLQIANKGKSRSTLNRHMKQIELYRRNRESGNDNMKYLQDILEKLSA